MPLRHFRVVRAWCGPQPGGEPPEAQRRDGAHVVVRGRLGEPHHAIHEHALLRATHRGLIGRGGLRVERRGDQPIDHFLETRQRGIDGMLRDHARGPGRLQHEPDRHIRGDRARGQRIEPLAGRAWKQLAMQPEARPRSRRNGVENLLRHDQFGGLERRREGFERLALLDRGLPIGPKCGRSSPRIA